MLYSANDSRVAYSTYGCKVPADIFVPSMAAGATFGRVAGIIVKDAQKVSF